MVFIILAVATVLLVAWLFVQVGRVTLGEFRHPRLREGSVQGVSPSGVRSVPGSVGGRPTETGGREPHPDQNRSQPRRANARRQLVRRQKRRDKRVLYDETDVEQAVRDRLYGSHGRHD